MPPIILYIHIPRASVGLSNWTVDPTLQLITPPILVHNYGSAYQCRTETWVYGASTQGPRPLGWGRPQEEDLSNDLCPNWYTRKAHSTLSPCANNTRNPWAKNTRKRWVYIQATHRSSIPVTDGPTIPVTDRPTIPVTHGPTIPIDHVPTLF